MLEIRGIGISGKKGTGVAFKYVKNTSEYHKACLFDAEEEIKRFKEIQQAAKKQVSVLFEKAKKDDESTAEIFHSHILLIDDIEVRDYIINLINQGYDLLSALMRSKEDMKVHFLNMQSEIFRSKVSDIDDVFDRLIQIESGIEEDNPFPDQPFILLCDDIIPSIIYQIPEGLLRGILVRFGSNCSHGAILARTKNIPVVIRLKNRIEMIKNNDRIIMNGESGTIFIFDEYLSSERYFF